MSAECDLLVRYLRQRRDLGEREVFLNSLTAAEAAALLRTSPMRVPEPALAVALASDGAAGSDAGTAGPVHGESGITPGAPGTGRESTRAALNVLAAEVAGCTRCRLHQGRTTVVFGEGNPGAELIVVGEAPGFEEDRTSRPFVGPAGKLLDLMLLSIGLPRESVFICNVLKCRPPNNRNPQPDEVAACSGYLHRQIELIAPKALLAVGKFSAQLLTGSESPIGKLRGRVFEYRGTPVVATFHPAFLLRSRQWTRAAWEDLQLVREVLDA